MKGKEFRLGNLVNLKNWQDEIAIFGEFDISQQQLDSIIKDGTGYASIKSIIKDEVELLAYGCDLDYYSCDEILPIPLTKEWFLKFGFENMEKLGGYTGYCLDGFFLIPNNNGFDFMVSGSSIILARIKYIHKLQNLYFELTEKELQCT